MFESSSRRLLYTLTLVLIAFGVASAQRPRPTPVASPTIVPKPLVTVPVPVPSPSPTLTRQIDDLSRQIENGITSSNSRTVAVVEFGDLVGNVTNFGRFLAEELTTLLYQKRFRVIERQLLRKVVEEQKLSLTGAIDQSSAQRLGKILGVGAIVSGTVTDLGQTLRVNARLISTETGEIVSVASVTIFKDESVIALMQQVTTSGDKSSASSRPATTNSPRPELSIAPAKVEAEFFTFELRRCRKSNISVLCEFVITNNDQDRQISLYSTRLYDEFGNEARSQRAEIANSDESTLLVSGVPVAARITFQGISPQATKITLLTVRGSAARRRSFEAVFRNIPLTN
jgi:TolB-like protein